MGTVIPFDVAPREPARDRPAEIAASCQIVIFPGVRIERHELDLAHRIREPNGGPDYGGLGGNGRPRKTS
jgi:hypothetical protein